VTWARSSYDGDWRGWWGEEPPYHAPVFVLTHYEREPVEMAGGTTFYFVTEGFEQALAMARSRLERPCRPCGRGLADKLHPTEDR
jgi:dihydrofolate reductase